jgi:hypothetical protein
VLQLLTLEEFHRAIARIIKDVTRQEGLASIEGNRKDIYIRRVINLLYNRPFSFFDQLLTLSIHNKMVVNTKMNCFS